MAAATIGIEVGFATLYAVTYPHAGGSTPACLTIELALRGALLLGDRELHGDDVVAHPGGDLLAQPARTGSMLLAIAVHPDAPIAQRYKDRFQRAEIVRMMSLPRFRTALTGELDTVDSKRSMALGGLVMSLLADCLRALESDAATEIDSVIEVIARECRGDVSVGNLAEQFGMRPSTLASRFRRATGMSVGAYVRQQRVELAKRLLVDSEMPVAAVARAAGFYDESHLDRCFRQLTGSTPAAYRRAARNPACVCVTKP